MTEKESKKKSSGPFIGELASHAAQRLKALRRKRGLSQTKLAELANTSTARISALENAASLMNLNQLENLSKALKVPPTYLVSDDFDTGPSLTELEERLLDSVREKDFRHLMSICADLVHIWNSDKTTRNS